jgi:diphosphomevalonate decarboxylase
MITKIDIVDEILKDRPSRLRAAGSAYAPSNIALCKYWGKRDDDLNLPVTSSLSVSLGKLGSDVTIGLREKSDLVELNGRRLDPGSSFAQRVSAFLDLFRPNPLTFFKVVAGNTVPTAAGFASSASGFAAMTMALDELFGWKLDKRELSILARLGSGSACRSVYEGFVEWRAGRRPDGMDSFAEPLPVKWPDLRLGLVVISDKEKNIGSRPAMKRTCETSILYGAWPAKVAEDLPVLKQAIRRQHFPRLGKTAESNALAMHATMINSWPPVVYWLPESVAAMKKIWNLREKGLNIYFTMDAGPNLKLLFLKKEVAAVKKAFPGVQIVAPFGDQT